jgi:hypothetical protein
VRSVGRVRDSENAVNWFWGRAELTLTGCAPTTLKSNYVKVAMGDAHFPSPCVLISMRTKIRTKVMGGNG